MINQESINLVGKSRFGEHFVKPIYDGYGFAQLPQTIRSLLIEDHQQLGVPFGPREDLRGKYDTVILFFIDAFGWRFLEKYIDHPFLKRIADTGLISKITSQFPSTTAAHVTAIHTGLPVGQSGIYEWFYYEPSIDEVISPLTFSFAGDKDRDTLLKAGVDPIRVFPTDTVYFDLANHGVKSWVIQDHNYTHSPYTEIVTAGASIVPYRSFPEAIMTLSELVTRQKERSYYFLYYDKIDSVCHEHGPNSRQLDAEIRAVLWALENFLVPALTNPKNKTLFLLTADHAHVEIDPATTIYLNESVREILPLIRKNRSGKMIVPAGSSRDMFVHIQEGRADEAIGILNKHLKGKAEVCKTNDLIQQCFFGMSPPSAAFLGRVGDIVILPYANESVWWFERGRFEQKFYGSHGGLTPQEMETIFVAQPF
jgi:hypothetical protein